MLAGKQVGRRLFFVEYIQDSEIIELDSEVSEVQREGGKTERLIPFLLEN